MEVYTGMLQIRESCDNDDVMIIMMKQFNGLLFGEVVLLNNSETFIASRWLFRKLKLFWKFAIVLEGRMFLMVKMFWIRIVLPGALMRYQALHVDWPVHAIARRQRCWRASDARWRRRVEERGGAVERQTRGWTAARSWRVLTNVGRQ